MSAGPPAPPSKVSRGAGLTREFSPQGLLAVWPGPHLSVLTVISHRLAHAVAWGRADVPREVGGPWTNRTPCFGLQPNASPFGLRTDWQEWKGSNPRPRIWRPLCYRNTSLPLAPCPGTAPGNLRLTGGSVRLLGRMEYSGAATENRTPIIWLEARGSSQTTTAANSGRHYA